MKKLLLGLIMAFTFQISSAALVDIPLPDGSYISNYAGSGLDVAWAAPCRVIDPSCGAVDLSFQGAYGWRLASAAEAAFLAANLVAQDFVFAGANVPLGGSDANGANFVYGSPGGDAACASPYFSPLHYHCDWGNGFGSGGADPVAWGLGQAGELAYAEAIVVRDVTEPGTLALFGLSILMLGAARRARRS